MYKLTNTDYVLRVPDGAYIPMDNNNLDYQEFLKWVSLGNSPEKESDTNFSNTSALREAAYKEESDPIFMEWMYDGDPHKEIMWRKKVAEIKARYPINDIK